MDDGVGATSNGTFNFTITPVNDNDPVITSSATPSVAENTTSVVNLTATDADLPGQTVSFSITGGADAARFQIVGGQLRFWRRRTMKRRRDADANNVYQVQVTANDGAGRTAVQNLSVTVTPVNDNDPVITSSATPSVAENTTSVVNLTATDADLPARRSASRSRAAPTRPGSRSWAASCSSGAAPDYEVADRCGRQQRVPGPGHGQ